MGRKKKEEPEIYHSPFGSTVLPPPDYFKPSPYIMDPSYIDVTTLGDTERRYITTTDDGTGSGLTYYPPLTTTGYPYSTTITKSSEPFLRVDKRRL